MHTPLTGPNLREQRLDEVIAAYFDDVALERAPRREELFALCPDLAGDLAAFFADCDRVERLAAPLRQTSPLIGPQGAPAQPPGAAASTGPRAQAGGPATPLLSATLIPEDPALPAFAGYEVLRELGHGGMGVVYLARQISLKRPVAIKVLREGAEASPEDHVRFLAEAEAVAHLKHPNIVEIHEVGEQRGQPFFSLEFVEGGSLHRRLAGLPLQPRPAAEVVQTLARAMHFAHTQGIVHRDLKPANVLLAGAPDLPVEHCVPKITDFGLAERLDSEIGQTQVGAIVGTPSYMAPEQASGQSKEVGPLADVYALGGVLYECLTGRAPFVGATPLDILQQVVADEPVPPRRLQPACPRDVETICLKCLQKKPHQRYASALELAEDLRRFLDGEPIRARPAGIWERGVKWARRRPAVAALIAVSSFALLVLAGLIVGHFIHLRASLDEAVTGEQRLQDEKQEAVRKGEEAENGRRLATRRAECQPLLEQADAALRRREPREAEGLAQRVQYMAGDEPSLADLNARAGRVMHHVGLFRARDEVLYHLNRQIFTGLDTPDNLEAARVTARKALAPFGMSGDAPKGLDASYSGPEKEQITQSCYELLLLLAEATARRLPTPPARRPADLGALRQALEILKRADFLIPDTQVYHLRRARYLALLGQEADARLERELAKERRPASRLDSFLVGYETWLEKRDPQAALPHFERALLEQENLLWPRFFLAVGHLTVGRAKWQGDPKEALSHFERARGELTMCIIQRPDFVWSYVFRGYINGELSNFEAAEADFDRAGQLSAEGLPVFGASTTGLLGSPFGQGPLLAASGRFPGRTSDPEVRYVLLNNRGVMRIRQERYDVAVADLKWAVALYPEQFQGHLNLASAYQKQKKWKAALDQLDEAVRLRPESNGLALLYRERAHFHLLRKDRGVVLAFAGGAAARRAVEFHLKRKDRGAALEDFQRAIECKRNGPETHTDHLDCALIHYEEKRYGEATRACDAALQLRPRYAAAHRLRGEAFLGLAKVVGLPVAGTSSAGLLGSPFGYGPLLATSALLPGRTKEGPEAWKRKLYREALRSFDRYLLHGRPVVEVFHGRALIQEALRNYEAAADDYARAFDLRPDAAFRTARGWCYVASGAWGSAQSNFEDAIRLDRESGDAHNGLGFARARRGNHVGAALAARTARGLGPKTPPHLYKSARVFAQAIAAAERERWTPDRAETTAFYRNQALNCLAAALDQLPEVQDRQDWLKNIKDDPALKPIGDQGFATLVAQYFRPAE